MPTKVLITNTCHVRGKLYRKGMTVDLGDVEAESVVKSGSGTILESPAAPSPDQADVEPVPAPRTAVDATAATTRKAVKLGG